MQDSGRTRRRDLDEIDRDVQDPFVRMVVRVAYHLRRYQPFYIFGLVWILMLALFPSVNPLNSGGGDTTDFAAGGADSGEFSDGTTFDTGDTSATEGAELSDGATPSGTTGGPSGSRGRTSNAPGGTQSEPAPPPEQVLSASGKTRGLGVDCNAGDQRQVPWSAYAAPCVPQYEGPNGGATFRGVTDKEIHVVVRRFPETANEQAVDRVVEQAGFASDEVQDQVRRDFIGWFNQVYELYGRTVKVTEWESAHGNGTDEAQSKGKEGACLDADIIAKELKAFGVWNEGSGPFGECAAERQLVHFNAGPYFPESWYRRYHPYVYHTLMECERIAHQVSEYIGKRLHGDNAIWAVDPLYRTQTRKFGTYVPDNDEYQHCVRITRQNVERDYGADPGPQYNYILDVSRFADEAAKGVVQFKAQGVTTLVLACDPISVIFLTQQAEAQAWGPEWLLIGVAATDTDNFGRLYTERQVDGHMFGLSQLGDVVKLLGPKSEAGQSYRAIPRDKRAYDDLPEGAGTEYYDALHIWNALQLAGPHVTPEALFEAYCRRYPPSLGPAGLWAFNTNPDGTPGCDHTAIEDSREVYWDGQATSPDGDEGTFLQTYGGKRFSNGQWPDEPPPIYPNR